MFQSKTTPGLRLALRLTVPNGTVNCAIVTLLALFFSQPENRKSRNPSFVYKASIAFLE